VSEEPKLPGVKTEQSLRKSQKSETHNCKISVTKCEKLPFESVLMKGAVSDAKPATIVRHAHVDL
jgi:hypothetical protein